MVHQSSRTPLSYESELGSLEDLNPEKRVTVSQIRKMRMQALKQEQLGFSIVRNLAKLWGEIRTFITVVWSRKARNRYCELNGHSPARIGNYGNIPRCRFCWSELYQPKEKKVSDPY